MTAPQLAKTIGLKACQVCAGDLIESDHFCRWCGVEQNGKCTAVQSADLADYETVTLRQEVLAPMTISQQLVSSMTQQAAARTTAFGKHWLMAGVIALLIAVPFWLLIILLSPLDAYVAARAASSRVQVQ